MRSVPHDVVALYATEADMEKLVEEAKALVEEIDIKVFGKAPKAK